jgi:hypothetical protein
VGIEANQSREQPRDRRQPRQRSEEQRGGRGQRRRHARGAFGSCALRSADQIQIIRDLRQRIHVLLGRLALLRGLASEPVVARGSLLLRCDRRRFGRVRAHGIPGPCEQTLAHRVRLARGPARGGISLARRLHQQLRVASPIFAHRGIDDGRHHASLPCSQDGACLGSLVGWGTFGFGSVGRARIRSD